MQLRVECLASICGAPGSIPSTEKNVKRKTFKNLKFNKKKKLKSGLDGV
jgi:hypothetical protein